MFICKYVKFILHLQQQTGVVRTSDGLPNAKNTIQFMKNSMLLPYRFKKIGWAVFIPTLLFGIFVALQEFDTANSAKMIEQLIKKGKVDPTVEEINSFINGVQPWLNNLLIIGILCGSLFITCSREKVEDEMIARIRLDALLLALYANTAIIAIAALATYGLAFVDIMIYNLFTLPLLFLVILRYRLWRLKKTTRNEE